MNRHSSFIAGSAAGRVVDQRGHPIPKSPALDWDNFGTWGQSTLTSLADMPNKVVTTSGRAALFWALQQMQLAPGTSVLVPTYHCPTMVAPISEAGLTPLYYPLTEQGLPDLQRVAWPAASAPKAMFVAHYFGLPQDLQDLLDWCEAHDILLVEDCAHSYFGQAGDRPVGQWGHYATASLSKFFPVAEAGLLASNSRPLSTFTTQAPDLRMQLKAAWDVVDYATRHGRLAGVRQLLSIFRPVAVAEEPAPDPSSVSPDVNETYLACDMGRIHMAPTRASVWLHRILPTQRIVLRRRANYEHLAMALGSAPGATVLRPQLPAASAPYVLPLWVDGADRADRVYAQMRQEGMPVFRWDRLWPGTPTDASDTGSQWSRHLLQVLCHQDLRACDVQLVAQRLNLALAAAPLS